MATKVQSTNAVEVTGGTTGTTLGSNVTAGNLLVLGVLCNNTDNTINTPTDSQGNTWTAIAAAQSDATFGLCRAFYAFASATAANTVQVSITQGAGGGGYKETILAEFNGPTTFITGNSALTTTLSLTTTADGQHAIAFVCANGNISAGSGYTPTHIGTNAVSGFSLMEHDLVAENSGGSQSVTKTDIGVVTQWAYHGALFASSSSASARNSILLLGVG